MAALTGCQVVATVDLTVDEDGSGEVSVLVLLDREAAARVPDLADDLRVRDLVATGWEVEGPTETDDGGVEIVATKPFADPEQGRQVLREIGGRGGILRAIVLEREHSFGETTWSFGGRLDLSNGLASFSDPALDEVLGGEALGQDQAALEEQLGEPLADTVAVEVTAHLPAGDFTTNGAQDGAGTATWHADLGDEPVNMAATSSERDTKVLTYAAISAGALALLVLLLLVRLIRGGVRRRRQRRHNISPA